MNQSSTTGRVSGARLSEALHPALSRMEVMLLEARDELARVLVRIQRRTITDEQYAELVDWATHLRVTRGLSPNTGANYLEGVALYLEWLNAAGTAPEHATAGEIEAWQRELFLQHREQEQTRRVKLTAVRRWYAWREALGKGMSPARSIQGPKRVRRVPRKFTKPQLQQMLATCDRQTPLGRRDYAILLFFLSTGARRMEVATLSLHQLELRERIGAVRIFGKGAKERIVPFEGAVIPALRAWFADRDALDLADRDTVFVGLMGRSKGQRIGSRGLDWVIDRAIRKADVRVESGMALHTLRATFATALYDAGRDLEEIRIVMGHEDINTTRGYVAISDRQMRVRLPASFIAEITGEGSNELPLWAKRKLERRRPV